MSVVKCVLFDCDGTLVDSEKLCCEAIVTTFEQVGVSLSFDAVSDNYSGGKIADVLSSAQDIAQSHVSLDLLAPIYREEIKRLFEEKLRPMEGVTNLLQYLDDQGIEYCVVTNGPVSKAEKMLSIVGLAEKFTGKIISAFDANSWKPEPDLLQYSVTIMGFLPTECLYVDDTVKGVRMGVSAGLRTIHFATSCDYELRNATCLTSMEQVIDYINEQNKSAL